MTGLIFVALVAMASSAPAAQEQPITDPPQVWFRCGAWFKSDVCNFALLTYDGARIDFALQRGETRSFDQAKPGLDRYMVSIVDPLPADPARCGRTRHVWCKINPVRSGQNQ